MALPKIKVGGIARIKHQMTDWHTQKVKEMAIFARPSRLASYFGISQGTFEKYYGELYEKAKIDAEREFADHVKHLGFNAESEAVQLDASKFYLKCKAGWQEKNTVAEVQPVLNIHIHS